MCFIFKTYFSDLSLQKVSEGTNWGDHETSDKQIKQIIVSIKM